MDVLLEISPLLVGESRELETVRDRLAPGGYGERDSDGLGTTRCSQPKSESLAVRRGAIVVIQIGVDRVEAGPHTPHPIRSIHVEQDYGKRFCFHVPYRILKDEPEYYGSRR